MSARISQDHLNERLTTFCRLKTNLYNEVLLLDKDADITESLDNRTTIYLQKARARRENRLVATWYENDILKTKAIPVSQASNILKEYSKKNRRSEHLINKVIDKFGCNEDPNFSFVDKKGNCNGWSFLYAFYQSRGQEEVFLALRKYIAKWDGRKFKRLPDILQNHFSNGQSLFEQTINDLVWFQHSTDKMKELYEGSEDNRINYFDRKKQYSMVKIPDFTISKIVSYDAGLDINHLKNIVNDDAISIMDFYSHWPDSWIDLTIELKEIGSNKNIGLHSIAIYVNPDGTLKLFDSNSGNKIINDQSPKECMDGLRSFYENIYGPGIPGLKVNIKRMNLHKFHDARDPNVTFNHKHFMNYSSEIATLMLKNAIKSGQVEFAEVLIRDYIPHDNRNEIVNMIIHERMFDKATDNRMINALVNHGCNVNQHELFPPHSTLLHHASAASCVAVVEALINNGANIDERDGEDKTPLQKAIERNNVDNVNFLIIRGASRSHVDKYGRTLLHSAIQSRNIELVQMILRYNPDAVNVQDVDGMTALHYIAKDLFDDRKQQLQIIDLLRRSGAEINIQNMHKMAPGAYATSDPIIKASLEEGFTPLHYAALVQDVVLMKELLNSDPSAINQKDSAGNTALYYAASIPFTDQNSQIEMVRLLRKNGADYNRINARNQSAFEIACSAPVKIALETKMLKRQSVMKVLPTRGLDNPEHKGVLRDSFSHSASSVPVDEQENRPDRVNTPLRDKGSTSGSPHKSEQSASKGNVFTKRMHFENLIKEQERSIAKSKDRPKRR